jgi:cerevisin
MAFSASFFTLALLALAAPATLVHVQRAEEPIDGSYIVLLRDDVPSPSAAKIVNQLNSSEVTDQWTIINGFAGNFTPEDLEVLRAHPDVLSIHEDAVVRAAATVTQYIPFASFSLVMWSYAWCDFRNNAPWGLERISRRTPVANKRLGASTFTYSYDSSAGIGVEVYVIGVYHRTLLSFCSLLTSVIS